MLPITKPAGSREEQHVSSLDASQAIVEAGRRRDEVLVRGELVYEYRLQVTRVVEYGASADALFSGSVPPPPEGARIDFYLDGRVVGPKLLGTVTGVDYLYFRPDGRAELHIHAEITTEDGKKISLTADGVATPERGSPVCQLRENVSLLTHHPEFVWVNAIQLWASGTVDVSSGHVHVKAYAA
jgi:hypothetical protein